MTKAVGTLSLFLLQLIPVTAFAQPGGGRTLTDFIDTATEIAMLAIPFAALLMIFFWSMWQIVMAGGDAEKRKQANMRLFWSIVVMFVVLTIGGIVAVLQMTVFGEHSLLLR